jgi:hypothetical protein
MKKIWSVLLSILLGAFVVGIGTGYFLYLANKDRQVLAEEANSAKLEAQQALLESQKTIEETNLKLAEANEQVANAEKALEALQNEQALLKNAEPLLKPSVSSLDGWLPVISTSMGISLLLPSVSNIDTNNEKLLAVSGDGENSAPWLKILPYSDTFHDMYLSDISSSTPVAYFIDGKVVAGQIGKDKNNGSETCLLKIYTAGSSTQMIWMQNPPSYKIKSWQKEQKISFTQILQTFEFQK